MRLKSYSDRIEQSEFSVGFTILRGHNACDLFTCIVYLRSIEMSLWISSAVSEEVYAHLTSIL